MISKNKIESGGGSRWFGFNPALVLATVVIILLTAITPASGEEAYLVDVVRTPPLDRINVSATLKGAFTPEIVNAIESGAPVTFTYFLELKRLRSVIWNETMRGLVVKRMVKYDTLRKDYVTWEKRGEDEDDLNFHAEIASKEYKDKPSAAPKKQELMEQPQEPVIIKERDKLEYWMTHLENIDMGPTTGLYKKTARYFVDARCEMKSIKLIPPFNYILFFVSLWDFDTSWASSTIFSVNAAPPADTVREKFKTMNEQ